MSQYASTPPAWLASDPIRRRVAPPSRSVVLRSLAFAGANYVLVLGIAAWLARALAGADSNLDLVVPALAMTIVAPGMALVAALIGWWPYRHLRLEIEDRVRHRSATVIVLLGTIVGFTLDAVVAGMSILIVGVAALAIMKLALLSRRAERPWAT